MSATPVTVARAVLGLAGLAALGYGLILSLAIPVNQLVSVGIYTVGGVVAHDGILAPLVVVLGVLVATRAPGWLRVPLIRLLVILGPLTLLAIPVLGSFGAKADNPTLLDRPYWLGYGAIVAVLLVLTAVDALRRRSRGPG